MKKLRLVYVENDPALRGIMSTQLQAHKALEIVQTFKSSSEALSYPDYASIDLALLDLALGDESLNGTELGMLLREKNPNIAIVIFTQHAINEYIDNLPTAMRRAWSFVEKRGNTNIDDLVQILIETSEGESITDISRDSSIRSEVSLVGQLTVRQRQVMSLAANGLDANSIAKELNLAAITVRQELSRAYAVLIPDLEPGRDLRTSAVLRYLREIRRNDESA